MKKILILVLVAACTPKLEKVSIVKGENGHSMVSMFGQPSEAECELDGSRLDIYLDLDDSLTVSEGDLYQGSLIVCNGANGLQGLKGDAGESIVGPQGEQGIQGPVGVGLQG